MSSEDRNIVEAAGALGPLDLEQDFERGLRLPALPKVAQEVSRRVQAGDADPVELSRLIEQDASFAAHILKVVNSAYFNLPTPVSNTRFAIAYLGMAEVGRIALSLSVMQAMASEQKDLVRGFWVRSYHTALISRRVSRFLAFSAEDTENLYAAALLHDVGKLGYAVLYPEHFRSISTMCRQNGLRAIEAEEQLGLPLDTEIGVRLASYWNLPSTVISACAHHELEDLRNMSLEGTDQLSIAVCVASLLSVLCVYPLSDDRRVDISREIQRVLNHSQDDFLLLMSDVYDLRDDAKRTVDGLL
ncbi:MAG: HDOD domain-containing protein [Myxococcota bacterium]